MSKILKIDLIEKDMDSCRISPFNGPRLFEFECSNILKKFEGNPLCNDDVTEAIDTLIAYFCQDGIYKIVIDIDKRDKSLAPAKEMTIEQIEKKLGYKIKIISDKENEKND